MGWWRIEESRELTRQAAAADRLLAVVGGVVALVVWIVGVVVDRPGVPSLVTIPTVLVAGWLAWRHAGALPTRLFMAVALMVLSAALIHEGGGMIEMHFSIFVMLAFLVLYRDWRTVVVAALVIAVHHLVFAQAQHVVFIAVQAAVLCLLAVRLRRETGHVGLGAAEMAEIAERMGRGDFRPDPRLERVPPRSMAANLEAMRRQLEAQFAAVSGVTAALAHGDLDRRVPVADLDGSLLALAQDVNRSADQLAATLRAAVAALDALSSGQELARVEIAAEGEFDHMLHAVNAMSDFVDNLTRTQGELVAGVHAGRFEVLHGVEQFHGFQRALYEGLNGLVTEVGGAMAAVREAMDRLAEGDLSTDMHGDYRGEFARLQAQVNRTMAELREMIGGIQSAAEQITTASGEIATGNLDLSARTERQAASLEETAASMEELTATVKQNADSARQANQLATQAAGMARRGGDLVQDVVRTMVGIEDSSRRVADIIGTIDGIAFQTNILALNAAVEAARAGEQGRGFAVVASEVRALAQRAAAAAKEIRGLIDDSMSRVGEGSALVQQTGETIGDLVGAVQAVSALMADISNASAEQTAGIEQVNRTITQMDEGTQQNAALVEEASAAAKAMAEQAQALQDLVGRFRLGGQEG